VRRVPGGQKIPSPTPIPVWGFLLSPKENGLSRPTPDESLTAFIRTFLADVRRLVVADEREMNPIDKLLVAITVVLGGIAVAWPRDRKAPGFAAVLTNIARFIWARRQWFQDWWNDTGPDGPNLRKEAS